MKMVTPIAVCKGLLYIARHQMSDLVLLCRIILLYQNDQLRPDLFVSGSHWLQRSKDFRAAAEPLDAQIRLQELEDLARSHMMPSLSPILVRELKPYAPPCNSCIQQHRIPNVMQVMHQSLLHHPSCRCPFRESSNM